MQQQLQARHVLWHTLLSNSVALPLLHAHVMGTISFALPNSASNQGTELSHHGADEPLKVQDVPLRSSNLVPAMLLNSTHSHENLLHA